MFLGVEDFRGRGELPIWQWTCQGLWQHSQNVSFLISLTGIRMGSWGLFLHSVISAITSLFLERLISGFGEQMVFTLGMVLFTILTGTMLFVNNISFTILLAAGTGLGTALTSTVPYTLLSCYHENSAVSLTTVMSVLYWYHKWSVLILNTDILILSMGG